MLSSKSYSSKGMLYFITYVKLIYLTSSNIITVKIVIMKNKNNTQQNSSVL